MGKLFDHLVSLERHALERKIESLDKDTLGEQCVQLLSFLGKLLPLFSSEVGSLAHLGWLLQAAKPSAKLEAADP